MNFQSEKGQAMAEVSIFSLLAVLLGFALLALIPMHRTRTAATAAAYACAQFVSQSVHAEAAVAQAEQIAWQTISADWSGADRSTYQVRAWHSGRRGMESGCEVNFQSPILFNGLLGLANPGEGRVSFIARSESWKARWP
jgi:hypothetical protein